MRHWEREGLVRPLRRAGSVRSYDSAGITEARIAAALRSGGYGIPAVSRIIDEVRAHGDTAQVQGSSLTSAPGSAPGPRGSADSRRGGR
ncbi:MerR family transcriptional regulator [Microbacterium oxydans]|uniref:MerR family transcriptional regulator n=1 Tax=Microbacterium oxydans TaxID=82380 RepID=UPI00332E2E94